MAKMPGRKMKFKLNIVVLGFLALCFFILILRTIFVACFAKVDGVKYGVKAKNRQMSANTIRANRGTIYDKNMVPIAQSATVWTITISPNQFKSLEEKQMVNKDLQQMLEIEKEDSEKITKRFNSKRKFEIIKKNVEKEKKDEILQYIKKKKLHNKINIEEDTKRYYPLAEIASHTIGFVGADNQGLLGLELFYDKALSGENGKILRIQDAKGGPMPYEYEKQIPAKNGNSIVVSLDSVIQRTCSEALSDLFKWHEPENRCLAIVMDIKTGEIVAISIYPEFDLNDPFTVPDVNLFPAIKDLPEKEQRALVWKNKAISENYEPGSVFKVLTASAALEEKTASLNSTYNCSGSANVQGTKMSCWKTQGHGGQNFTQACVNSCNPAFVAIGQSLGSHKFCKYLDLFGMTKKTKIDLPGETDPIYYKEKDLTLVSLASESFGQSLSITPMQMINTFSAVVNGGTLNRPHILKQILDHEGNIIKTNNKKPVRQAISKETSNTMIKILTEVVKGPQGTGTNSSVAGYVIAGKTGTGQKLKEKSKTGEDKSHISSFAGLLTADQPRYAIMVLADSPTHGKIYGSDVASPTFNRIASKIAPYLGFTPKYTKEQFQKFFNKLPACEGMPAKKARKLLEQEKFTTVKIVGDSEEKTVTQLPSAGVTIPKDSLIYLYTDEESLKESTVSVPSVVGMSFQKAKETLNSYGLNMVLENIAFKQNSNSTAMAQFPEEGTSLAKGSIVEVNFQTSDGTG